MQLSKLLLLALATAAIALPADNADAKKPKKPKKPTKPKHHAGVGCTLQAGVAGLCLVPVCPPGTTQCGTTTSGCLVGTALNCCTKCPSRRGLLTLEDREEEAAALEIEIMGREEAVEAQEPEVVPREEEFAVEDPAEAEE